jgi:hypothetical protein
MEAEAMSDVALLLGPIAFRDFEVPSRINFGGRQRLAVYRLPDGSRVIDALGRDDAQIVFSGIFTGSDAAIRARSLDKMRVAGAAFSLSWDVLFYTVLISEFLADYRNGWWIPYRIVCTVLRDEGSTASQQAISLVSSALTDINTASGYLASSGVGLSAVQAALTERGATTRGTSAYVSAQSSLTEAQSAIAGSSRAAEVSLSNSGLSAAVTAQSGVTGLLAATDAAGQLSSLVSGQAYVRRTANYLANAST